MSRMGVRLPCLRTAEGGRRLCTLCQFMIEQGLSPEPLEHCRRWQADWEERKARDDR